jgi:hypothetical protein
MVKPSISEVPPRDRVYCSVSIRDDRMHSHENDFDVD